MRKLMIVLLLFAMMGIAEAREHDNLATNTLQPGSLPPVKGLYYTLGYNNANSSRSYDVSGKRVTDGGTVSTWSVSNYFIWVPGVKFLGADYGIRASLPFVYMEMSVAPNTPAAKKSYDFGLVDPLLIPLSLNWNFGRASIMVELGTIMPLGSYSKNRLATLGQDHWTITPRLGSTFFFDEARTWSISGLLSYEYNFRNHSQDITQGDQLWFIYGAAKRFNNITFGLYGYCSWKLEEDSGIAVNPRTKAKDETYAIGPELSVRVESLGNATLTFKYLHEFISKGRSATDTFRASIGWKFL